MRIAVSCPHCSRAAKPVWRKVLDMGLASTQCDHCGRPIKLDVAPSHTFFYLFILVPGVAFSNPFARFGVGLAFFLGLGLFRALRYAYRAHLEPIVP